MQRRFSCKNCGVTRSVCRHQSTGVPSKVGIMRTLLTIFFAVLLFGNIDFVSAKPHRFVKKQQEVEVQVSHEKTFSGFKIKFVEMIDDSRCPRDVNCVWAGNARILVQVSKKGKSKTFELNSLLAPQAVRFEGYEFKLTRLTPEPASNIRIRKDGYVATIKVAKKV